MQQRQKVDHYTLLAYARAELRLLRAESRDERLAVRHEPGIEVEESDASPSMILRIIGKLRGP